MQQSTRRGFLALAGFAPLIAAAPPPKIPRQAPNFTIYLGTGQRLELESLRGKVVALEMLLTTCPHCQRCAATMQKLHEEFSAQGLAVVGAAVDDGARANMLSFLVKSGARFPVGVADRSEAYRFLQADTDPASGGLYFPQLVFIDRKGIIQAQFGGTDNFFLEEEKNARAQITSLLGLNKGVAKK